MSQPRGDGAFARFECFVSSVTFNYTETTCLTPALSPGCRSSGARHWANPGPLGRDDPPLFPTKRAAVAAESLRPADLGLVGDVEALAFAEQVRTADMSVPLTAAA